jgi:hypothetical protein
MSRHYRALSPREMADMSVERVARNDLPPPPEAQAEKDRQTALNIATFLRSHPCALDPEAGITTCDVPGHDEDVERIRTVLESVGLYEPPAKSSSKEWLTAQKAADLLGVSAASVRSWGSTGRLERMSKSGQWFFSALSVERLRAQEAR